MNKEQMRIAIAEACGWTKCRMAVKGAGAPERSPSPHGFPPSKNYEASLPYYLDNLNAMATAEAILPDNNSLHGLVVYHNKLLAVCGSHKACISATAEQRAEAFLKTIDKWVP